MTIKSGPAAAKNMINSAGEDNSQRFLTSFFRASCSTFAALFVLFLGFYA